MVLGIDTGIEKPSVNAGVDHGEQSDIGDHLIEQRKAQAGPRPLESSVTAKLRSLPDLELTDPTQLSIANHYQDVMRRTLGMIVADVGIGVQAAVSTEQQPPVFERTNKIALEQAHREWGPESQRTFREYLDWLQKKVVPAAVSTLNSLGVAAPPGSPPLIPAEQSTPTDYETPVGQQAKRENRAELSVAAALSIAANGGIPSIRDVEKIEATRDWLIRAKESASQAMEKRYDKHLQEMLGDTLPASWRPKEGEDKTQWRSAVLVGADLYERVARNAATIDLLCKLGGQFPPLPAGVKIEYDDKQTVKKVNVDLPDDLSGIAYHPRFRELVDWLEKVNPPIKQSLDELKAVQNNPYLSIAYYDKELASSADLSTGNKVSKQALLDQQNRLVRVIDPVSEHNNDGLKTRDINLLERRFHAERVNPSDPDSDVIVKTHVQAKDVISAGYNMIYGNATEPMAIEDRRYKANDMVEYEGELVKAKELPSKEKLQAFLHYGGKAFTLALDSSMAIGGAGSIAKWALRGTAAAAAELSAEKAGLELAAREASAGLTAKQASANATRQEINSSLIHNGVMSAVGVSGFFANNAAAHDTRSWMDDWRDKYFCLTLGLPSAQLTASWLSRAAEFGTAGAKKIGVAQSAASNVYDGLTKVNGALDKAHVLVTGGERAAVQIAHSGPQWLSKSLDTINSMAGKLQYVMGAQLTYDAYNTLRHRKSSGSIDPISGSSIMFADGQSQQSKLNQSELSRRERPLSAADKLGSPGTLEKTSADADRHALIHLTERCKAAFSAETPAAASARKILDTAAQFAGLTAEQQQAAKREWSANIGLTGEQVKKLEQGTGKPLSKEELEQAGEGSGGRLSEEQLSHAMDPIRRSRLDKTLADNVQHLYAEKEPDVVTASRMALLLTASAIVATKPEAEVLATNDVVVPAHNSWQASSFLGLIHGQSLSRVDERKLSEKIDPQTVVDGLLDDLAHSRQAERTVVLGDLLSRAGAVTPQQYGRLLQNILDDPQSTAADKMRIMTGSDGPPMAAVIDRLHAEQMQLQDQSLPGEAKVIGQARDYANSYADRMRSLAQTAANDANETVRAMASANIFGLKRLLSSRQEGESILSDLNDQWQMSIADSGSPIVSSVKNLLISVLQEPISDESLQRRIDSAQALSLLSAKGEDRDVIQQQINRSLAEAFMHSNLQQSVRLLDSSSTKQIKGMIAQDGVGQHVLGLLSEAGVTTDRENLINLLQKTPELMDGAEDNLREAIESKLKDLLKPSAENFDANIPVRVSAIRAAKAINSLQCLDSISRLAAEDASALVRETAVQTLSQMHDPELPDKVDELLKTETDDQLRKELKALRSRFNSTGWHDTAKLTGDHPADSTTEVLTNDGYSGANSMDNQFYRLPSIDAQARAAFLKENDLALLDHEAFIQAARQGSDGHLYENSYRIMLHSLEASREAQFKDLIALARGDAEQTKTQIARKLLASIVTSDGKQIQGDGRFLFGLDHDQKLWNPLNALRKPEMNVYYTEKPRSTPWSTEAAQALADIAENSSSGFDLNARLIGSLLASDATLRSEDGRHLLRAWKSMNRADEAGRYALDPERYKHVVERARQNEKQQPKR